jgi:hypothetical protein
MAKNDRLDITRRTALKGAGLALGISTLGASSVPVAAARNKRHMLRGDVAEQANAVATRDEKNTAGGSWTVDGTQGGKFGLYLDPESLPFKQFGTLYLKDVTRVSYYTKTEHAVAGTTPENFYLTLYTKPDGDDDDAWYGRRLTGEPYFSPSLDAPGDQWNEWSLDAGTNQLVFHDSNRTGVGDGFYGAPTFDELMSTDAFVWSDYKAGAESTPVDYRDEELWFVSFQTGSGWFEDFTGYIDTIEIGIDTAGHRAQTLRIDLEV